MNPYSVPQELITKMTLDLMQKKKKKTIVTCKLIYGEHQLSGHVLQPKPKIYGILAQWASTINL